MNATVKKWAAIGLAALTLVIVFFSWITLTGIGKYAYEEAYYSVEYYLEKDIASQIRDLASEYSYYFDENIKNKDVNKIINNCEGVIRLFAGLKNGISPAELSRALGLTSSTINVVSKYPMIEASLDDGLEYTIDMTVKEIRTAVTAANLFYKFVFFATLAALVAAIAAHLLGMKHSGIPAAIGVAVLTLIHIVVIIAVNKITDDALGEPLFALTAWPFIALAFIISSVVLWSMTGSSNAAPIDIMSLIKGGAAQKPRVLSDAWVCSECGTRSGGGVFCSNCGAKRAEMPKCPNCGTVVIGANRFCTECGTELSKDTVCAACGNKLAADEKFCPECGTKR